MHVYIIGSGAIAGIVKLFFPSAVVIAPGGRNFLPIHYLWATEYTERFLYDFDIEAEHKVLKVFKATTTEEQETYNKLTHKPPRNKPSEGKREIEAYMCMIPEVGPDIKEKVVELTDKKIITENGEYEYDIVFVCSPLLFKPYSVKYYPLTIYKATAETQPDWDYAYLGGDALKIGVYRMNKDNDGNIFVEQAGDVPQSYSKIEEAIENSIGMQIRITKHYPHPFAHFDAQPQNASTSRCIMASRLSNLNNEFLMSDTIKLMYELTEDSIEPDGGEDDDF